jgi:hypothetical protein
MRTVMQRKLPADEAHLLSKVGSGTGGIEDQLVADGATEQLIDGLLPQPA